MTSAPGGPRDPAPAPHLQNLLSAKTCLEGAAGGAALVPFTVRKVSIGNRTVEGVMSQVPPKGPTAGGAGGELDPLASASQAAAFRP